MTSGAFGIYLLFCVRLPAAVRQTVNQYTTTSNSELTLVLLCITEQKSRILMNSKPETTLATLMLSVYERKNS